MERVAHRRLDQAFPDDGLPRELAVGLKLVEVLGERLEDVEERVSIYHGRFGRSSASPPGRESRRSNARAQYSRSSFVSM